MNPTHIVLHCSALAYGTAEGIRAFHLRRGWADIGYHFVIENGRADKGARYDKETDGLIVAGRDIDGDGNVLEEQGAHALGYNNRSIGVCLVGCRGTFTTRQMRNAAGLIAGLCYRIGIPVERVIGHYETEHEQAKPERHRDPTKRRKTCPELDMHGFRRHVAEVLEYFEAADELPMNVLEQAERLEAQ